MANPQLDTMVKTLIETQVIQALNSAPEAIEKMVKAAINDGVNSRTGNRNDYGDKVPYLEYMVAEEIRSAAQNAVRKIMLEKAPLIEAEIRKGLSSESVVAALTNAFVGVATEDWRIDVKFTTKKDR